MRISSIVSVNHVVGSLVGGSLVVFDSVGVLLEFYVPASYYNGLQGILIFGTALSSTHKNPRNIFKVTRHFTQLTNVDG